MGASERELLLYRIGGTTYGISTAYTSVGD